MRINDSIALLAAVFFAVSAGRAMAAERQVLRGHVPAAVKQARLIGRVPGDRQLRLCIGLTLRNPDALDTLLRDLYDPASPRYHQYLTPEQFAAAFAPAKQDYAAVVAYARAHGLVVAAAPSDGRLVDVTGTAADVERAFHVTLREYRHPTKARNFFAPDIEPSVDAGLTVADVWGISDYPEPQPLHTSTLR